MHLGQRALGDQELHLAVQQVEHLELALGNEVLVFQHLEVVAATPATWRSRGWFRPVLWRRLRCKTMAAENSDLSQPGPPMMLMTLVGYSRILDSGSTLTLV